MLETAAGLEHGYSMFDKMRTQEVRRHTAELARTLRLNLEILSVYERPQSTELEVYVSLECCDLGHSSITDRALHWIPQCRAIHLVWLDTEPYLLSN